MSNVLSEAKKQQVIALGRLGWPLRRIEQETGGRRETAGAYLKAAGSASPESVGTATAGKTGQRGDHRGRTRQNRSTRSTPTPTPTPTPKTFLLRKKQKQKQNRPMRVR